MSCENDCRRTPGFPRTVFNRPGLPTIAYRIGSYADLREHMLSLLDASPRLAEWTHRLPDDPGIALLEAAAEVGDILAFYQDLYANEAYLRSAKWRDSVADLVRLPGYRLAPGVGGKARFALGVKGTQPVVLPKGLGIKVQLDPEPRPADFETSAELVAEPALSRFHLYRPRVQPHIRHGTDTFVLALEAGAAVTLEAGDRVMVGIPRGVGGDAYDHTQVLEVDKTWTAFGNTVVKMKGGVTSLKEPGLLPLFLSGSGSRPAAPPLGAPLAAGLAMPGVSSTSRLQAWKLGGTHRHFGHNAPPRQVDVDANGRATTSEVSFARRLDSTTAAPATPALAATQIPLDSEVAGMVAGTRLLIEARVGPGGTASPRRRLLARRIVQVERQTIGWGPLSGASTMLSLDATPAIAESGTTLGHADIRSISLHEVIGEPFGLHADFVPGLAVGGSELYFYGTAREAAALAKRTLLLSGPGDTLAVANALSVEAHGGDAGRPAFHRVQLDRTVDYARFGHDAPQVSVYGNLVEATQGKTEARIALGDGDGRAIFQTFALPRAPLTYLLDAAQSPPRLPQLQVWVDGVEWTQVDSLFGHGPKARVYVVREDADGKSWVQFGDGKTGARLRSGRGNVVAVYRTGNGAHGPLKPGAKPAPDKNPAGLDAVWMPEPATGGAQPESIDGARSAAPGTMQSLGRIVSLADYEAEALSIPGVLKARAAWVQVDGAPLVRACILTGSGAPADAAAAADALRAAVRARGAGRCPLLVVQGARTQVGLHLAVGSQAGRRADEVRAAILEALGATGEEGNGIDSSRGLFSWQRRGFGEGVHGSQVVAAVQDVPGVAWVRLRSMSALDAADAAMPRPAWPSLKLPATQRSLACAGDRVLALSSTALHLQLAVDKEALPS